MNSILEAQEKHISDILEIWKELMEFHRGKDPRYPLRENVAEQFNTYLKDLLNSPNAIVLIAKDDKQITGFGIAFITTPPPVFKQEKFGEISDLIVSEKFRRKGIGSALHGEFIKRFQQEGIRRVEINVASKNSIGLNFWKKKNFKEYSKRMYRWL